MTCSGDSSDDSCGDAECTDTPDIVEYEHVDPEQVAEKEQAASRAETDVSLVQQAAVSQFQAAHCRGGRDSSRGGESCRVEKRGWAVKRSLEKQQHQADTALNGAAEKQQ